ncbi:MAG: hypothetical protein JO107_09780 [Hyphomicrobiales bacterium]|nr:hypothetical protein [Hyphomicrobiales bacterium]MBV8663379.1 hypothetical protein [Hyphomicrobiales bacterium]
MNLLRRGFNNDRQRRRVGGGAETRELLQDLLRLIRMADQPADHQVHHVVRVSLCVQPREIPAPLSRVGVEGEQTLVGDRVQKLNCKKWVAGGLLLHQVRQLRGGRWFAANGVRNQLAEVRMAERPEADLPHPRAGLADRRKLARERMCGVDLVVAVSADQQQMA